MQCPRCGHEELSTIATSPVEGAWEMHQCDVCMYSWRSTENVHIDDVFKLDDEKIAKLQVIPPVPPLEA